MVFNLADSNIFYLKENARVTCDLWAIEGRSRYLRLHLNWLQTDSRNDFPENGGVWLLLQIRSNWKAFSVNRIWEPKQRKWFSVSIFTSNYFQPWKIRERERERERENRSQHHRPPTSPAGAIAPIAIKASHDHAKRRLLQLRSRRSRSRLRLSKFDDFFSGFCLCFEE